MKKTILPLAATTIIASMTCCGKKAATENDVPNYVTVKEGKFYIGDSVYEYLGTNFWYASILGSEGEGGDRERLGKELDKLKELGFDNLRVMVGAEGRTGIPSHVQPVLQPEPGVYNDTLLAGLDYLMAELEKRDMRAILFLTNAWEWSGGYGAYLEWAGMGECPDPVGVGYKEYCDYVSQFVSNDSAKKMLADHINFIVSRTNRYTEKPYSQSPAIMAWEIANEPRAFARDSVTLANFEKWVITTAKQIKELDPNHLVATGSEGAVGCEGDIDLWARIHNAPEIDYSIIHIWPANWGWVTTETLSDSVGTAIQYSKEYIDEHAALTNKPLVLEEFGYPRDNRSYEMGSPITARDKYYEAVLNYAISSGKVQGINFWAWGGYGKPSHRMWQPFDQYLGDPAHEPQGLYSVFLGDSTTVDILTKAAKRK